MVLDGIDSEQELYSTTVSGGFTSFLELYSYLHVDMLTTVLQTGLETVKPPDKVANCMGLEADSRSKISI